MTEYTRESDGVKSHNLAEVSDSTSSLPVRNVHLQTTNHDASGSNDGHFSPYHQYSKGEEETSGSGGEGVRVSARVFVCGKEGKSLQLNFIRALALVSVITCKSGGAR